MFFCGASMRARLFAFFSGAVWFVLLEGAQAQHVGAGSPKAVLSAQEIGELNALGPWPPPARKDPSNRASGQPQAIELGRRLFADARMSPVGYIACVTCHQPDRAFTDLKARAHGLADLPRNTPSLFNLSQQRWFGRDGASDSLWLASIRPMLDAREFDGSATTTVKLFVRDPELAACYRKVFGVSPLHNSERTVVNVGKALAAYQETLVTTRTPFDDFRDATIRGDAAAAHYPEAAQRGLKLFVGEAKCINCHSGPNFSDDRFHKVTSGAGGSDDGRMQGVRSVKSNPFNLTSRYNDDPTRISAQATRQLVSQSSQRGQFRTPGLRNVTATAPYMHDGKIEFLQSAVQHGAPQQGPALTAAQTNDLVAFLATLTDRYGATRPWNPQKLAPCHP
jgi:cytochrome c peroxidase